MVNKLEYSLIRKGIIKKDFVDEPYRGLNNKEIIEANKIYKKLRNKGEQRLIFQYKKMVSKNLLDYFLFYNKKRKLTIAAIEKVLNEREIDID